MQWEKKSSAELETLSGRASHVDGGDGDDDF
jgi:hypothetical protein